MATATCQCYDGFIGADCAYSTLQSTVPTNAPPAYVIDLSPFNGLKLSAVVVRPYVHMRVDMAVGTNWTAIGIGADPADGMSHMDAWAVYQDDQTKAWKVEDQFNSKGQGQPIVDKQQDLMNATVWQPTFNSLAASWTRMLTTSDLKMDLPLLPGLTHVSWAVGPSTQYGPMAHKDDENNGAGQIDFEFYNVCPNSCTKNGMLPVLFPKFTIKFHSSGSFF